MDTAGMILILVGIYLLTSAVKNRRPIETARAIIRKPGTAKQTMRDAQGYQAQSTGAPRLSLPGSPSGSAGDKAGDPSMYIGGPLPTGVKLPGNAEAGLKPNAIAGGRAIYAHAPWLKTMYGMGSRPIGTSDHPRGLAIDFMIPSWSSQAGNARGWELARWIAANSDGLKVKYIIWDVKKFNPSVSREWRPYTYPMGNSNPTVAHRDHIHVSFKD